MFEIVSRCNHYTISTPSLSISSWSLGASKINRLAIRDWSTVSSLGVKQHNHVKRFQTTLLWTDSRSFKLFNDFWFMATGTSPMIHCKTHKLRIRYKQIANSKPAIHVPTSVQTQGDRIAIAPPGRSKILAEPRQVYLPWQGLNDHSMTGIHF